MLLRDMDPEYLNAAAENDWVQQEVARMTKAMVPRDRLGDHMIRHKLEELARLKRLHCSQMLAYVAEEEAEESRRRVKEKQAEHSMAIDWVRKKHNAQRFQARQGFKRLQHDLSIAQLARMSYLGFVR